MSGTLGNNKALYNNNVVIKPFSTFIGTGLVQVYLFIYLSGMRPLHSSQDVFNRNTFLKTVGLNFMTQWVYL